MNIESLIQTLESAAELATDGEWLKLNAMDGGHLCVNAPNGVNGHMGPSIGLVKEWDDAQAIAIRHNTAAQVVESLIDYKRLVELQDTSGHWGRIAAKFSDELKAQRARADRAELKLRSIAIKEEQEEDFHTRNTCLLCDEYVSDVPSSNIIHRPDCLLTTKETP